MTARMGATALILCGGRTTRFGGDKARACVGGRAVIDRVIEVVAPITDRVVAVTSAGKADLGLPDEVRVITDRYPGTGPLGGICTGLEAMQSELALVVACDLPFLNGGLLRFLLSLADGFEAVVPRREDGRAQPLPAVYARGCRGAMQHRLAAGRLSVWRVLEDLDTRYVEPEDCRRLDPDLLSFFNLNTPGDLAEANRVAASRSSAPAGGESTGAGGGPGRAPAR